VEVAARVSAVRNRSFRRLRSHYSFYFVHTFLVSESHLFASYLWLTKKSRWVQATGKVPYLAENNEEIESLRLSVPRPTQMG